MKIFKEILLIASLLLSSLSFAEYDYPNNGAYGADSKLGNQKLLDRALKDANYKDGIHELKREFEVGSNVNIYVQNKFKELLFLNRPGHKGGVYRTDICVSGNQRRIEPDCNPRARVGEDW